MEPADFEKLIEVWKVLEVLTVSLDRLGMYEAFHGEAAAREAIANFTGPLMFRKIAEARGLLIEVLEAQNPGILDRLEAMADNEAKMGYWDGPEHPNMAEQGRMIEANEEQDHKEDRTMAEGRPLDVLDTKRVYDGKLFKVDVEDVRLPSGREAKREIVRHPGAVALLVLDADDQVILVRQYRRPADRYLLEIPAGTREAGEDAEACARREVQEETGHSAAHVERLGGFFSAPGFCTEFLDCYLCTDLGPTDLHPEEDEDLELERLSLTDAWAAAARGEITDAKTLAALALYTARQRAPASPASG